MASYPSVRPSAQSVPIFWQTSTPGLFRTLMVSIAMMLAVLSGPVMAQDDSASAAQADPDAVLATVGGEAITASDLAFAAEDLGQDLANVPPADRRAFLLAILVDMKVMAQAARVENMQESAIFKRRQSYLEDRSLRRAYFADKIGAGVTDEAVQAAYDELAAAYEPQEEVRARHILVPDEEDAKTIRAEIEAGKPFEVAAMENSIDGSAQGGGDLGYFTRGMMVPPFEEAAFALEVGAMSEPVQSQFGWHLIKLEDRRTSGPPPLEEISAQLSQQVLIDTFDGIMAELKDGVEISFTDPAMAEAVAKQQEAAQ